MAINWTEKQRHAIYTHDRNLLVSAAAGSGKTAVLAARCVALICDPERPCDADQLLVVTFTNAAAAEMRQRIARMLAEKARDTGDPRLQRQTLLLAGAQIGTIHGFCATMLRRYFHELGLDPAFRLLDEDEASLMRNDLAIDLVERRLQDPQAASFGRLVEQYAGGSPKRIADVILRLYSQQSSLLDPTNWLAERRAKIEEAIDKPLPESSLGDELLKILEQRRITLASGAERLSAALRRVEGFNKYADYVAALGTMMEDWNAALRARSFDQAADIVQSTEFERLPALKPVPPEKEAWQKRIEALRNGIKSFSKNGVFRFTEDELKLHLRETFWAIESLAELVEAFKNDFDKEKRDTGVLDFNDLERLALRLLHDKATDGPTPIALAYRRQFRHVLVDEYQDVNELQDTLLAMLADESAGNIFCVGDVKQSIYRFRQADPQRFINRYKKYKDRDDPGEVIDLQTNFRSRGPLLEVLNAMFERLMTRESAEVTYNASQRLVPGAIYPDGDGLFSGSPIELHIVEKEAAAAGQREYESDEREAILVASRLRTLLGRDGTPPMRVAERDGATRPAEPGDVAVLLRAMRIKAERFATILRQAGIPVQADSTTGFFAAMEVQDVLATLRAIDNQRSDYDVAGYLRSPLCGLPAPEDNLAEIRLAYPNLPFHQAAEKYVRDKSDTLAQELGWHLSQLEIWRKHVQQFPVADVIQLVLNHTSYAVFCAGLPDGQQRSANLAELLERARGFEKFRRPTLSRFLHYIATLEEQGDLGMPPADGASRNAVRIMSVHKSKGLEFPIVVLPDLGKEHNLRDASGLISVDSSVGLALRGVDSEREAHFPSLASTIAQHHIRRRALAEELRVLYVATTRAREHLILIGTEVPAALEEWDQEWRGHVGPLPAGTVLAGKKMLDWVGPAAALAEANAPGSIVRSEHTVGDIEALGKTLLNAAGRNLDAGPMQKLQPIPSDPPSARVQAAIDRITYEYPFAEFAKTSATLSVTDLAKSKSTAPRDESGLDPTVSLFERLLKAPRFTSQGRLSAADAGTVTHAILQKINFRKLCDRADLEAQIATEIASLIERRVLRLTDIEDVKIMAIKAIEWFAETDTGRRFRAAPEKNLLRELEVIYADTRTKPADPNDQIVIRGRVDVILVEDDGLTLVDYKTDDVTPETLLAPDIYRQKRLNGYRNQLKAYGTELSRITGRPVKEAALAFLSARVVLPT